MKILVTDDDPVILELLTQFLTGVGKHEISTAGSAAEAIALLAADDTSDFDCFLIDMVMPGMDGIALTRHIRQTDAYRLAPVIMLTVMTEKTFVDQAFEAGATDYITKPFELGALASRIAMVEKLVTGRQAADQIILADGVLLNGAQPREPVELGDAFALHNLPNVIAHTAMQNYVAHLSRSALFGATVFGFSLRKAEVYCDTLTGADFKFMIEDVAKSLSETLQEHPILLTYAGNGTFVCIVESGWRPDMAQLCDRVNVTLSQSRIISNTGAPLHPRLSAGAAIRLVWKSGNQIVNALTKAQVTAEHAAQEYERLKTDFFHIRRSA